MTTSSDHVIVSYPRSGSNYFQLAWKDKNKQHVECLRSSKLIYKISKNDNKKIIGLIRNPVDAISSRVLIGRTHENTSGTEEDMVKFSISEYIMIYHYIIKNAHFIVDISDLSKVDKLVETISGLQSSPIDQGILQNKLNNIPNYSASFVGHKDYDATIDIVKNMDIELCQALYDIAYSKRLMV
jgi:hypothetical protein